jgi:hypothetical protein
MYFVNRANERRRRYRCGKEPKVDYREICRILRMGFAQAKMANALGENQEFVMDSFPPDLVHTKLL